MVDGAEAIVRSVREAIATCDGFPCDLWVDIVSGACALSYDHPPGTPPEAYCECWAKAKAAVAAIPPPPVVGSFG